MWNAPSSPLLHEVNLNGPSTLYQINTHETRKKTLEKGFDARSNFVHFAHGDLNVIPLQELMERPSVRNFLYRSKWFQRPSALALRTAMRGGAVAVASFLSLVAALFCGDVCALLGVAGNAWCDAVLSVAFGFFVLEFLLNAASDRSYPLSFFFYMDLIGTFSMVFDISYLLGPDAMAIERLHGSGSGGGVIVMRAARAARIGARAGRLSRVAKVVRFLSGGDDGPGARHVRMAKVISNKLSDVLSIRVAFVVIVVAVVLPSLSIFEYPEMEESLTAWASFVAEDVTRYARGQRGPVEQATVHELLRRLQEFYASSNYGPFLVCYHPKDFENSEEMLDCTGQGSYKLEVGGSFGPPARREFIMATSMGRVDVFFNLAEPKRLEALMGISLILFIILAMVAFSVILTENIATVALLPLERMLDVVRQRCAQIFRYTDALQEEVLEEEDSEEEEEQEAANDNEFALLEKAVAKLGAIASLSAQDTRASQKVWTEDEIMVQQWTQQRSEPVRGHMVRASLDRHSRLVDMGRRMSTVAEDNDALESLEKDVDQETFSLARTPDFDACKLTSTQLKALSMRVLREHDGTKELVRRHLKPKVLFQFVQVMEQSYFRNPFHNFDHAVDVTCWLSMQLADVKAKRFLADSEQLALLIAGLGHDLGHLGVNNNFLVATSHELAVIYNDQSPLENMHCCKLFQILGTPETKLLDSVEKETYKQIRRDIIEAILHTDITKHNEMVKDLSLFYQMNKETLDLLELSQEADEVLRTSRALLMNSFLHAADVSNPSRPWGIAEKLAQLCMAEFFAQGDREKELGVPVGMLNDREKVNTAHSQIGFIEFMIAPWVEALVPLFGGLEYLSEYTAENINKWAVLWEKEVKPPQEQVEKVNLRVQKVVSKLLPQKSKAL